jgi:hypothetical protein
MMQFRIWLEQNTLGTDEVVSQIDGLYDKAKYAIKIAQMYVKSSKDPNVKNLLKNISTIAPLNSGVYGLYNSAENKAVIGRPAANRTRFTFNQDLLKQQDKIQKLPIAVIRQYMPDIDPSQIIPSDVIHVNVQSIVSELGDSIEAVLEIASTIIHEATHDMNYRNTGKSPEADSKAAETPFLLWAQQNMNMIQSAIPQLRVLGNQLPNLKKSQTESALG